MAAKRTGRPLGVPDREVALACAATDPRDLEALTGRAGGAAGLAALLGDLDQRAVPRCDRRGRLVGFGWEPADDSTRTWWPQGVSTSGDASATGAVHGRHVVAVSWYSRDAAGRTDGSRVTFVDVTDPADIGYRHALLVRPVRDAGSGAVSHRPVPVHAGGIVWYGDLLYVAATRAGLRVFDLADLVRVDPDTHGGFGYVLPQRWAYEPVGAAALRFSFVSLDRSHTPHTLLAGEYGRGAGPKLVAGFELEAGSGRLRPSGAVVRPVEALGLDLARMQGVARVDGTLFVSTSRGRLRGDLWVARPGGRLRRHGWALPAGSEDLGVWPQRGQLWSLTEHPGRRRVVARDAASITIGGPRVWPWLVYSMSNRSTRRWPSGRTGSCGRPR